MGFSCIFEGKDGEDILKKYDIYFSLLHIFPSDRSAKYLEGQQRYKTYFLHEIRLSLNQIRYADEYPPAAQDALNLIKGALLNNLLDLEGIEVPHCENCQCKLQVKPEKAGFNIDQAKRFLSIPEKEVYSFTCSM